MAARRGTRRPIAAEPRRSSTCIPHPAPPAAAAARLLLLLLLRFLLLLRLLRLRLRLLLLLLLRLRLLSMLQQHRLLLPLLLSRGRPRIKCWNRLTLAQYAT